MAAAAPGLLPTIYDRAAVAALDLDPDYVRRVVYVVMNADGSELEHPLERWAGGALIFCAEPGVDLDLLAQVADEVRSVTGLQASVGETGCNVHWTLATGTGHSYADRVFNGHAILSARLVFYGSDGASETQSLHEVGHVLGLGHSIRREDVMYATPDHGITQFSPAEVAVLHAMYGRQ